MFQKKNHDEIYKKINKSRSSSCIFEGKKIYKKKSAKNSTIKIDKKLQKNILFYTILDHVTIEFDQTRFSKCLYSKA